MSSEPERLLHFYWLHCCASGQDGFHVKTSGWEDDLHSTGIEQIHPAHSDYPAWQWIHAHRLKFPPVLSLSEFASLKHRFLSEAPEPRCPEDGYYFVAVPWSGPAVEAREALERAHKARPLPRPLKVLDGDSAEPSQHFPHLTGLLHGWGEIFGFSGGKCDFYHPLSKNLESLPKAIEQLYE